MQGMFLFCFVKIFTVSVNFRLFLKVMLSKVTGITVKKRLL